MEIDLTERELNVIKKVFQEKAIELRGRSDYYQNDEVQADYFEVDVLARRLGKINTAEDKIEKFLDKGIEKENTEEYGEIKKQIKELNTIIGEYEKINKYNTYNFRIRGLTDHIEALESIVFNEDLASDWKVALQEDQEEFQNNLDDEWDLEM